jgi:tetraacyldisaccharide 4'-kinase
VREWLRHRFAGPVLRASVVPAGSTDWLKAARVVAWAGIGAPQRFFATLQALGADVVETVAFRDHQWLGEDDARRLLDLAQRHSATPVTTEKDMARLAGAHGLCGELRGATRVVPVRLALAEADAERLLSLVATALQAQRR